MSWPVGAAGAWPAAAGGVAAAAMGGQNMNMAMMGQYTPEQWAAMQQQNWQQWNQWQQQYAQWQSQYGDKYAAQMQAMQALGGSAPPLPTAAPSQPAPPPPDNPPPPPYENNQPLYQSSKSSHTSVAPPVPNAMLQANSGNTPNKDNARPPARGQASWDSNWNATSKPDNPNSGSFDRNQPKSWTDSGHDNRSTEGVNSEALKKHAEEERLFDIQFRKWEEEFEKWKKENVNHPDKRAYAEYEQKFETCRAQLMERRQQMKQKRLKLMSGNVQSPKIDTPVQNINVPPPLPPPTQPPKQQQNNFNRFGKDGAGNPYSQEQNQHSQRSNTFSQDHLTPEQKQFSQGNNHYSQNKDQYPQDKNLFQGKNQFSHSHNQYSTKNADYNRDVDKYTEDNSGYDCYDQEPMENSNDSYNNSNFLSSSDQRKGIPGLDLVEGEEGNAMPPTGNSDVVDITDDTAQNPDYSAALSKGINNILGDEKILNILSMVQGQKIHPNVTNALNQKPNSGSHLLGNQLNNMARGDHTNNQNSGPNVWSNQNREGPMNRANDDYSQNEHQADRFNNMLLGPNSRQMNIPRNQRPNDFAQAQNFNNSVPLAPTGRGDIRPLLNARGQDFRNNSFPGPQNMGMNPNMRQNMGPSNRDNFEQDMGPQNKGMIQGMGPNRGMHPDMGPLVRGVNPDSALSNRGMNHDMGPPNRGPNQDLGPLNRGLNQDMAIHNNHINLDMGPNRGMNPDMGPNRGMNPDMGPNRGMNPDMGPQNRGINQGMLPNRGLNPNMAMSNRGINPDVALQNRGIDDDMGPRGKVMDVGAQRPNMFMTQERGRGYGPGQPGQNQGLAVGGVMAQGMGIGGAMGPGMGINQGMGNMNRGPNAMALAAPPVEPVAKWDTEPIMEPFIIVDYEHKPLRMKVRDFIEPVQTFDYNHISTDKDYKKDVGKPSDRWSELDVYNQRSGTKVIDYQNKSMDDLATMESDRRPARRFDNDRRDEFSERRERLPDRNYDRMGERRRDDRDDRRDDRSNDRRRDDRLDDRRRDDRSDDRRRDERMRHDRYRGRDDRASPENRPRDRSRDRGDWNRDRGRDRDSRKREKSKEKIQDPSIENVKAAKPNSKDGSPGVASKHLVMIDDLLEPPGRDVRPEKLVIILRGIPGSGKTYLAKLIKEREVENGGSAPRILSIDDYFIQESEVEEKDSSGKMVKKPTMKYVYDEKSEEDYLNCLKRAYRRTLTDQFFPFIIVDAVNDQLKSFADMWNFGRQNGFQVYVCTMECDAQTAFKRNIHGRSLEDIQVVAARFLDTPSQFITLDATTLLQNAGIQDVHMEDVNSDDDVIIMEDAMEAPESEITEQVTSKWEKMDDSIQLARLDGTNKPLRPSQYSLDEYLQLDDWQPARTAQPGKKTVRWADIEERRQQEKVRAIGFVVGQTDWHRMTDPTLGSGALTQMKYIERARRN